jgi:hypothetical protein
MGAMLDTVSPVELVSDLRYALDVMEESSHLGLDDEHARLLRDILQRRIDEACAVLSVKPADCFSAPSSTEFSE